MDIERGICQVWFDIVVTSVVNTDDEETKKEQDDTATVDASEQSSAPSTNEPSDAAAVPPTDEGDEDKTQPSSTTEEEKASESSTPTPNVPPATTPISPIVVTIVLDASLPQNSSPTHRLRPMNTVTCYPFSKPIATFSSGSIHLPVGSTLQDGDRMDIDCDWTPSLHLRDAALNVALKLKESIKRNEPIYRNDEDEFRMMGEALSQGVSQGTQKVKSFFLSVRDKAAAVADELDKAVAAERAEKEERVMRQLQQKQEMVKKNRALAAKNNNVAPGGKVVDSNNVEIGDVINLAINPWNQAIGMHSCKAIRRPEFVEAAIKLAAADGNGRNRKEVAGSGVSATGSFFQTFRQNAKSLVEESFLMLTPNHIIEISCNKFSVATATVTYAIPVSSLSKLKFRREESISLFFRQSPDDPAIYMCNTSAEAVKELQGVLKKYGVRGKHTNATMQRCVKSAIAMIDEIQAREIELEEAGEFENRRLMVEKIMNLYRQAAEQFELAGDVRHEEVMVHMHEFLAKPLVAEILDKQSATRGEGRKVEEVPEGEVLARLEAENDTTGRVQEEQVGGGDDEEGKVEDADEFHRAMEAAESMLKDAHDDLKDLGIDDELDVEEDLDSSFDLTNLGGTTSNEDNDVVSEFEDMLKDADKELAELMGA